jgi:4'-phosphopantetheinyl transferase
MNSRSSSHPSSSQQNNDVVRTFVRVWHAASSSAEPGPLERCCEQWLDDNDLKRAQLLRRPTTRNQHIVGRGMARRLLGSDAVEPQSIRFEVEAHGKPYVLSPDVAKQPFNLAHTDGLVMCGIGDQRHEALGVDVERLDRRTDVALADRYFSQPEINYLKGLPGEEARRLAFLKIWTLKESFIKAIGTGLSTPLADFAFDDIDSDSPSIRMLNPNLSSDHSWKFYSIEPRAGFIGAIAVATKHTNPVVELELCCFEEIVA